MKEYDIAERAYKNGYEAGVKEFAEKVLSKAEASEDGTQWVSVKNINAIFNKFATPR